MSRSLGGTRFTILSPIQTFPFVTSSRPATIRSAVVFPHPEGPTRTTNSPSPTSRSSAETAFNSKGTIEALKVMRDIYKRGMTDEIFAWTASSNNQGYLSGRLSMALNAISIIRTAEAQSPTLAANTAIAPIPRGPHGRLGLEHVMGVYTIWKFTKNKKLAKRFIADLEINYQGAFKNSKFYNFP